MPSTLAYSKATMLNDKIYVIGARSGEYVNNSLLEYDPVANNWTERKSLLSSRRYFAVTTCQNKIYVIGGSLRDSSSLEGVSTNEVYDPLTDTWEFRASMPTARWGLVAETVNGKIYVISGRTGAGLTSVDVNEVYDPITDSWTNASSIPTRVSGPASAVVDNKIYVIGGQAEFNDPMNPGFNQIYDPESDTWTQGAKEPNPEWNSAAAGATTGVMAPKMIYVMGGNAGFADRIDQNYAYNPKEDTWIVAASLPAPRASFAVAVVNDLLYVIGGGRGTAFVGLTASVEQYTPFGYGVPDPSYDGTPPEVTLISPANRTYYKTDISLEFLANEPVSWMRYELDNENSTAVSGNTTISGLSYGSHNVTVYAIDAAGNTGTTKTITFTVAEELFPVALVVTASIASAGIIAVGLVLYFRKRKKGKGS